MPACSRHPAVAIRTAPRIPPGDVILLPCLNGFVVLPKGLWPRRRFEALGQEPGSSQQKTGYSEPMRYAGLHVGASREARDLYGRNVLARRCEHQIRDAKLLVCNRDGGSVAPYKIPV